MSLAFADICIGIIVVPAGILGFFSDGEVGPILCRICQYFALVSKAARIICMSTISADRFRTHLYPHKPVWTLNQCRRNILLGWGFASLYAIRAAIVFDIIVTKAQDPYTKNIVSFVLCGIHPDYQEVIKIFLLVDFICLYFIPLILLIVFYPAVICKLANISFKNTNKSQVMYTDEKKKRIIIMLLLLVVFFGICKLPLHIFNIFTQWGPGWIEGSMTVQRITELVSFTTSWLNVIIVVIFNDELRKEMISCLSGHTVVTVVHPEVTAKENNVRTISQEITQNPLKQARKEEMIVM